MRREAATVNTQGQLASIAQSRTLSESELLTLFLTSPSEQREQQFADTARVAEMTGLSRRTIQIWIDIGLIQAIRLGRKKYAVSLESLRRCLQDHNAG